MGEDEEDVVTEDVSFDWNVRGWSKHATLRNDPTRIVVDAKYNARRCIVECACVKSVTSETKRDTFELRMLASMSVHE